MEAPAILRDIKSELHRIKDALGVTRDALNDRPTGDDFINYKTEIDTRSNAVLAKIDAIEKRVDWLDKHQSRGFKEYSTLNERNDKTLRDFGQCFTAARMRKEGRDVPEAYQRAISESAGTADVTVPTETVGEVLRIVAQQSHARQHCRVIQAKTDRVRIPTILGGLSSEFLGDAGTADASDQLASDMFVAGASSEINIETLVSFGAVGRDLDEDELVSLEMVLAEMFAEALAARENQSILTANGGAEKFTGVLRASGVPEVTLAWAGLTSHDSFADVNADDLRRTLARVNSNVQANAQWMGHPEVFSEITGILDSQNRPIFNQFPLVSGAAPSGTPVPTSPQYNLYGRPFLYNNEAPDVTNDDAADTAFLAVGDWKKLIFADRRQITIEWDDSVLFRKRQRAIMVSERYGCKVFIPGAFARLKTGAANS